MTQQQYCLVEDGRVTVPPQKLPKNWKNVSGLHLASDESLKKKGWLPVDIVQPDYDESTQKLGTDQYEIKSDRVIVTTQIINLSIPEIETKKQLAATEYQRLRQMEYPASHDMIVALWEQVVENRPETATALQEKRIAVKTKYPKP